MATRRPMTIEEVRQRILDDYQVLVDFEGSTPEALPAPSAAAGEESWKSWSRRVLGPDAVNVRVYLAAKEIPGQTKLKTLVKDSPAAAVKALVKAIKADTKQRVLQRQTLASVRAEKAAQDLKKSQAAALRAEKSLHAADAQSGLENFVGALEQKLAADADADPELKLDELVRTRTERLLDKAKSDTPIIDLFWDLVTFADRCRAEYKRTLPPAPQRLDGR